VRFLQIRQEQSVIWRLSFSSSAPRFKGNSVADRYAKIQKKAHAAAVKRNVEQARKLNAAFDVGDPIRGKQTDFVRTFSKPIDSESTVQEVEAQVLNFRVQTDRLAAQLEKSRALSTSYENPLSGIKDEFRSSVEDLHEEREREAQDNAIATEAVKRIVAANVGNSKDRLKRNIDTCIETFGRHNTDTKLPNNKGNERGEMFRAGKDTGSSEVQIAILTAKINNLANNVKMNKDKHNKRNLQMLVHKRQKLMKYLHRKEQGGPRWQNLISTLGLTEATWKGQINL
jgi:ribosomal protein S15